MLCVTEAWHIVFFFVQVCTKQVYTIFTRCLFVALRFISKTVVPTGLAFKHLFHFQRFIFLQCQLLFLLPCLSNSHSLLMRIKEMIFST